MKIPVGALALLLAASACTNGGTLAPTGASANVSQVTKIDVSLAAYSSVSTPAGSSLGFSPAITTVSVGSGVQFVNVDNTSHTATAITNASTFPATSPFSIAATTPTQNGNLSSGWSSGTMLAGGSSQVFLVDKAGTYLYGCFFHYSGGMRGMIVAH